MTTFPAGYTVMVVGAASGIGRAAAASLATRGATVAAYDRDFEGVRRLAAGAAGGRVIPYELDITNDPAVARAVSDLLAETPQVHALVNTVGINPDAGVDSHCVDLDTFDLVYRVNLRAAMVLSKAILPSMLSAGYGRIAHVASVAGKEGNPKMASYSTSKAGLMGLVKVLGKEYANSGITINAVAPAVIRTPLVDATPDDVVQAMIARIPMRRTGTLAEIAAMLSFIVSPDCSYTTGFTFDLSGGRATY